MPIPPAFAAAVNAQVAMEFNAAYLYLAMSTWFEGGKLPGFSHWYRAQSQEEITHAEKFIEHLLDRDAPVTLSGLSAPKATWGSVREAVEDTLANEVRVTAAIHSLYDSGDHASRPLLLWFINEQIEEEKSARDLLERLDIAADDPAALLLIDQELGART